MPVIVKLPSGNWRAQARRKGRYINNTFRRRQRLHLLHSLDRTQGLIDHLGFDEGLVGEGGGDVLAGAGREREGADREHEDGFHSRRIMNPL